MDIIYFIIRYIPFWAIPLLMISLQFSYTYWLKNIKRITYLFVGSGGFAFFCIVYYYWAGGPVLAVSKLQHFFHLL